MRCVIIEDQLPAQRILKKYIEDLPNLELLATFTSAVEALSTLQTQHIDLLFLDIHLPKLSGINFLKAFPHPPNVIITTAYPDYALEGFELDVVDYLLKPFSFERFIKAVSKVTIPSTAIGNEQQELEQNKEYVFVKSGKVIHKVEIESILYMKAEGDFIRLVTTDKAHLVNASLGTFHQTLSPSSFVRCHKSYVVHLIKIDKIVGNTIYIYGTTVPIGRKYKDGLLDLLEVG